MHHSLMYDTMLKESLYNMTKIKRIQWFDAALDRWHKYDSETNELLNTKMTEGPYSGIDIVKQQPLTAEKAKEMEGKRRKKVNYLANKELLLEFRKSKEQGKMTDKLAHMLQLLVYRISRKGNFANYTYIDDMRSYAMLMLMTTWHKFDPEKSDNPFAYYTTCIGNSYVQILNQEKRQRTIRDQIMVKNGLTPSFAYQEEHAAENTYGDYGD